MSLRHELINKFFQIEATFDEDTGSTREVTRSFDRAQPQLEIITVKQWKRRREPIAHGGSGIIWLEHDEDGKERAVKQISKFGTTTTPLQIDYKRELQALGHLSKYPDLFIQFYGWFENEKSIFLAMEYFKLGDLEKFITPKLTERDVRMIGKQLLKGLQVLHADRLVHRDLKPENIFVAKCAPDWSIKLGDYGILRRICTAQKGPLTCVGTANYMAPEMIFENDDEDQDSPYTVAVDIWSLGCTLFRLLTHQFPFPEYRHFQLYWRSTKPFPTDILINHSVSKDGISFLSDTMKSHPADRISVAMALLHPWVSNQECTPKIRDFGSKSADEGSATKSCKCIPVSFSVSNYEDNQPFSNVAITPYSTNDDISPQVMEQLPKPKDLTFLEPRSNLANSYLKGGQYQKAMQLFEQIVEVHRLFLGDKHPDTLRGINNLAKSFTKLGRYQEAMHSYKQTLDLQGLILGDNHPDTICSMYGLAEAYSDLGQYKDGIHLHKKTLELRKRILGDEHPDTLESMSGLALSYSRLGQSQEAMHLKIQTLALRRRILGNEDPNTLQSMFSLAVSYVEFGQYQGALDLAKETLALQHRILGDSHPDTLWSMHVLAVSYCNLGEYQEASHLAKEITESRKQILGDEHPDTIWSMSSLAVSYFNLGQCHEAMHLDEQTLKLRERILGNEHPDTLESMHGLAASYFKLGRYQEAMDLNKKTTELRKRVLGDEHPDTLWSTLSVAVSNSKLGQDEEAMQLRKETLEIRKRLLGDEHPDTLWSMFCVAVSHSNLGQDEEAMELHQDTLKFRKNVLGNEHPYTLQSMSYLAKSYSKLDLHKEAVQLGEQAVEAQRRILGPDHPDTMYSAQELATFPRHKQGSKKKKPRTKSQRKISRYLPFTKLRAKHGKEAPT